MPTTAGRRLGRGARKPPPRKGQQGEAAGCEPLVSVEEAAGNDPGCAAEPGPAPEAAADAGPVPGPEAVPGPPGVLLLLSLLLLLPPLFLLVAGPALPGGAGGGLVPERRGGRGGPGAVAVCGGDAAARVRGAGRRPGRAGLRAGGQPAAARLLAAVSACIGLDTPRPSSSSTCCGRGRAAGRLVALPDLRTLRRVACIADRTDPLRLQQMFAAAMLAADPVTSGVYYIDYHFVLHRRQAARLEQQAAGRESRADTHVTAPTAAVVRDRRAVRLSVTLPKALAELKESGRTSSGWVLPRRHDD